MRNGGLSPVGVVQHCTLLAFEVAPVRVHGTRERVDDDEGVDVGRPHFRAVAGRFLVFGAPRGRLTGGVAAAVSAAPGFVQTDTERGLKSRHGRGDIVLAGHGHALPMMATRPQTNPRTRMRNTARTARPDQGPSLLGVVGWSFILSPPYRGVVGDLGT